MENNNVVEAIRNEVSIVKVLSERLDSIQSEFGFSEKIDSFSENGGIESNTSAISSLSEKLGGIESNTSAISSLSEKLGGIESNHLLLVLLVEN